MDQEEETVLIRRVPSHSSGQWSRRAAGRLPWHVKKWGRVAAQGCRAGWGRACHATPTPGPPTRLQAPVRGRGGAVASQRRPMACAVQCVAGTPSLQGRGGGAGAAAPGRELGA